jgi:hypothetical protein
MATYSVSFRKAAFNSLAAAEVSLAKLALQGGTK